MLAFLAIGSGAAHSRDRLAGLLWSEHGDQQARDSLKQALARLRRGLGDDGGGVLRADRQSIGLDRDAVSVDTLLFERLVRDGTVRRWRRQPPSIRRFPTASRSAIPPSRIGCWWNAGACVSCSSGRSAP